MSTFQAVLCVYTDSGDLTASCPSAVIIAFTGHFSLHSITALESLRATLGCRRDAAPFLIQKILNLGTMIEPLKLNFRLD